MFTCVLTCGVSRAKSSKPLTISLARLVSRMISSRSSRSWASMFSFSRSRSAKASTPVKGLLISWATPAARRPTEASCSLRPTCCRVACLSNSSRSWTAWAMLSTARHNTPISPGGRMPTRAERSPPITFWAMATTRRMGRSTNSVASTKQRQADQRRSDHQRQDHAADHVALMGERGLQQAHAQHPDDPACRVPDRLIRGEVPIADDERRGGPNAAAVQHLLADGGTQLGPHRPGAVFRLEVGGNPQVPQEDRHRADLFALVDFVAEHLLLDRVDDLVMLVEQIAAVEHGLHSVPGRRARAPPRRPPSRRC